MLSKYKKSLELSSHIISDSRVSQQSLKGNNILQGNGLGFQADRQQMGKQSLKNTYHNTQDNNMLIRKIPQLISQNDQLKLKVQKLQSQLQYIIQSHSLSSPAQSSPKERRTSRLQHWSYGRSNRSSLDNKHRYMTFESSNDNNQSEGIKISKLLNEIESLKRTNRVLLQQKISILQIKQRHNKQIDAVLAQFNETLKQKEQLYKHQIAHYEQKIRMLTKQAQYRQQKMKESQQQYKRERSKQVDEVRGYKLSQGLQHLWSVKDAEYGNIGSILHTLNNI